MTTSHNYAVMPNLITSQMPTDNYTRLEPRDRYTDIREGIQARVKDPLFFLARQSQAGEFGAFSGGRAVRVEASVQSQPLDAIIATATDAGATPVDPDQPLDYQVEREVSGLAGNLQAPYWENSHLEYRFDLTHGATRLKAAHFDGRQLDWHTFDIDSFDSAAATTASIAVTPEPLNFPGAPLPAWWRIEDYQASLSGVERPELNYLAMLLVEFSLLYANDWYLIPVRQTMGTLRRLDQLHIIDSFGVMTELSPVIDTTPDRRGWEAFTLSAGSGPSDGRLLFLPNASLDALTSDDIETVSVLRDESANLVWAIEHLVTDVSGPRNRDDEEVAKDPGPPQRQYYWDVGNKRLVVRDDVTGQNEPGYEFLGPAEVYQGTTYVPLNWVPFLPRQLSASGLFLLRRGRTAEDPSLLPQYKGNIIKDAVRVAEEEVPRTGIELTRVARLARDYSGNPLVWVARKRCADTHRKASGWRTDALW